MLHQHEIEENAHKQIHGPGPEAGNQHSSAATQPIGQRPVNQKRESIGQSAPEKK